MTTLTMAEVSTPAGDITLALSGGCLSALAFTDRWPRLQAGLARRFGAFECRAAARTDAVVARLRAYLAGDLRALDDVAVDPGGTPFQRRVWAALRRVPPGRTVTYGELARRAGCPGAARAVGAASGANPIWIVIPCHRAIGADGRLTGYAGGLTRKRWLLAHEGARLGGAIPARPRR